MNIELFALGDWGAPPEMEDSLDVHRVRKLQEQVARAMSEASAKLTADGTPLSAVLALGDNFYGRLDGPDDARFKNRLEELYPQESLRVPFYFVLGNHDYMTPGSDKLQRESVPLFLSNWRMPESPAAVAELGRGVSLVLFDSDPVFRGIAPAELAPALRADP